MAFCKPDLVAAVLTQLGHKVPDSAALTKAVFAASAELKRQNGIDERACLLLSPVKSEWYSGSVREGTKIGDGGAIKV